MQPGESYNKEQCIFNSNYKIVSYIICGSDRDWCEL